MVLRIANKVAIVSVLILTTLAVPTAMVAEYNEPNYEDVECSEVHQITGDAEKCYFIQHNPNCAIESGYINYEESIYCTFQGPTLFPVGLILLIILFAYLFLCVSILSDAMFVPNIAAIAKALHFSESVTGETLLPIGNGAPDIFTSIAAVLNSKPGDVDILYGSLLGSGTFITTMVTGTIIMIRPFRTMERPILRVIIFYMLAIFVAFTVAWDGVITLGEAAAFIILYVVYMATVLLAPYVNRAIIKWAKKRRLEKEQKQADGDRGVLPTGESDVSKADYGSAAQAADSIRIIVESSDECEETQTADDSTPVGDFVPMQTLKRPSAMFLEAPPSVPRGGMRRTSSLGQLPSPVELKKVAEAETFEQGETRRIRASTVTTPYKASPFDEGNRHHHRRHSRRADGKSSPKMSRMAKMLIRQASFLREEEEKLRAWSVASSAGGGKNRGSIAASNRSSRAGGAPSDKGSSTNLRVPDINNQQHVADDDDVRPIRSVSKLEAFFLPDPPSAEEQGRPPLNAAEDQEEQNQSAPPAVVVEEVSMPKEETAPAEKTDEEGEEEDEEEPVEDKPIWRWLLDGVNPIDVDEWKSEGWFSKIMQIIKIPPLFFIYLTDPIVDEEKPLTNWNRALNSLHCATAPLFILFSLNMTSSMVGDVYPLMLIVAAIGVGLGLLVFMTSENLKRPYYHVFFAVAGFVVTAMWIYLFANEVVNLIQCFGLAFGISESLLSITFLAYGISLPDFVNTVVLARQGYSKMAISASIGSGCFNTLIGLGLPLVLMTVNSGVGAVNVVLPDILTVMFGFLGFTLVANFIAIPIIQQFYLRRPFAIFLFAIYAACLVCIILAEVGVITFRN